MPLHPMVVHFPVALLLTGFVFDLLGALKNQLSYRRAALYMEVVGFAGGVLAVVTGKALEQRMANFGRVPPQLGTHQALAVAGLVLFAVLLAWRVFAVRDREVAGPRSAAYLLLGAVATVLITAAAYVGGEMAHRPRQGGAAQPSGFEAPARGAGAG